MSMPICSMSVVLPKARDLPSTTPFTPMPDAESNCSAFARAHLRCRAALTTAAAKGCSLPWSRLAARRNTSSSEKPLLPTARSKVGLPSVRVPVLSTINVSTLQRFSIAAASRNSTPCVAPRPLATMMDIGVASPKAQGQAMISLSPTRLVTGNGSPVSIDSSSALLPSITTPSTGTFSPGRTRRLSPSWTWARGMSSSLPSGWTRRAVLGDRPSGDWMAAEVLERAFSSSN